MNKIPKIIHYCWVGGNEYPEPIKSCMESWKKHLGDYEVICWNESNFDINCNKYVKEAYEAKKWAFVSDYIRLYALYHHGGIYMDADVRVLKDISPFLECSFFSGYENKQYPEFIPTGIIGAEKSHPFIFALLEDYAHRNFIKADGTFDLTTNVVKITHMAEERYGFKGNGDYQVFGEDIHIFPYDYFSGFNGEEYGKKECYDITDNTYTIHEFAGSWLPKPIESKKSERLGKRIGRSLRSIIGHENYQKIKAKFRLQEK